MVCFASLSASVDDYVFPCQYFAFFFLNVFCQYSCFPCLNIQTSIFVMNRQNQITGIVDRLIDELRDSIRENNCSSRKICYKGIRAFQMLLIFEIENRVHGRKQSSS